MRAPGLRSDPLPGENAVVWVSAVMGLISAVAILILVIGMTAQVITRWVADTSLPGMTSLAQAMLLLSIFFALSWAAVRGEHISVRLVTDRLPDRSQRWIDVAIWLVTTAFMVWLTWASAALALRRTMDGESNADVSLVWPIWPWRWVMAVGLAAFTVMSLMNLVRSLLGRRPYDDSASLEAIIEQESAVEVNK